MMLRGAEVADFSAPLSTCLRVARPYGVTSAHHHVAADTRQSRIKVPRVRQNAHHRGSDVVAPQCHTRFHFAWANERYPHVVGSIASRPIRRLRQVLLT